MKRTLFFAALILFAGSLFTSCTKCSSCMYEVGNGKSVNEPEICGSTEEVDNYKKSCDEAAAKISSGNTCTCTDK